MAKLVIVSTANELALVGSHPNNSTPHLFQQVPYYRHMAVQLVGGAQLNTCSPHCMTSL